MRPSLLGLWTPLGLAAALGAVALALRFPPLSLVAGAILVFQGARVAYNHRDIGDRFLRWSPSYQFGFSSAWYARQLLGFMLVFLAVTLVVVAFSTA